MKLDSVYYIEGKDSPYYWESQTLKLRGVDLIVGKNASGKTRVLNVINGLAQQLRGERVGGLGNSLQKCCFSDEQDKFEFELNIDSNLVVKEFMKQNEEILLIRDSTGLAQIKGIDLGSNINFNLPKSELASTRADSLQFPFLQKLQDWANGVKHFRFNSDFGKRAINIIDSGMSVKFNEQNTDRAVDVFIEGQKRYGDLFINKVVEDLNNVGYNIQSIYIGQPHSLKIKTQTPEDIVCLLLQEKDRDGATDQYSMSMGLYRVVSILIYFNFWQLTTTVGTFLIDDIGEGLDYERSGKLISLLIDKTESTDIQLVMSTNSKFIMNLVPLKYWQIIDRKGGHVKFYNKENSSKTFEDFKFVGLNNFDFFTSEFFKTGFEEE